MGAHWWAWAWACVLGFQFVMILLAPVIVLPLFNKFTPLPAGTLRDRLLALAERTRFRAQSIQVMDGSKRSRHSNAFFTGFGRFRRIVLFDTLIAKHTVDELVSVLAHEMGHYRKKHILTSILISIATTGLMFCILSLFINNTGLFAAFRMEHPSVYASLLFFGFLYTPIEMVLSIAGTMLSRKHEYEADAYSVTTYRKPEAMITALKKLSVDNLSNLTPHPLKVFLNYSHPPVLERIQAIRKQRTDSR
jgi:STE24 endopeptidase